VGRRRSVLRSGRFVGWRRSGCSIPLACYAVVIVLFVVVSLLELTLELALMPFVVLLRLVGAARWPVEIVRQGKHFATK